jgi:hypothetical protein
LRRKQSRQNRSFRAAQERNTTDYNNIGISLCIPNGAYNNDYYCNTSLPL